METVQSFLTYHAFEGGRLTFEEARKLLEDALMDCFLIDAQSIDQVDVEAETRIANATAARMLEKMGA